MGIVLYAESMPGSPGDPDSGDTELLREIAVGKEYQFKTIIIDWSKTVDDWTSIIEQAYDTHDPAETEIWGKSLGGVAALNATTRLRVQPRRLCLMSPSAAWAEDLSKLPPASLGVFNEAQREAFARLSFDELAPRITCPTLLMMGSLEDERLPLLAARVRRAAELIPNARLVIAEDAGHGLYYPGYYEALRTHL
jgi:pimeloyl-ACP methyl ester carboxylesterase